MVVEVGQKRDDGYIEEIEDDIFKPRTFNIPTWKPIDVISTTNNYIKYGAEQIVNIGKTSLDEKIIINTETTINKGKKKRKRRK